MEASFEDVQAALAQLEALRQQAEARVERRQRLREIIDEIDAVAPVVGELDQLDAERSRLRNASTIGELLGDVVATIYEGDPAASEMASRAARNAAELAELDPDLAELAARLGSAAVKKTRLADLSLSESDLDQVAKIALETPVSNPEPVSEGRVRELLQNAHQGVLG